MMVPPCIFRHRLDGLLASVEGRGDADYIMSRVDYYNKLQPGAVLPEGNIHERERSHYVFLDEACRFRPKTFHEAYFFDLNDVMKYFPADTRIGFIPGDVYFTPPFPAFVKSRLLSDDNQNSVLLKLDKQRHFFFVDDRIPFEKKQDMAIFRGKIRESRLREKFLAQYFDSELCDCGIVDNNPKHPEWRVPKKTIAQHLQYKYIMALEGNDVASNLKWVMSSNSIAVMTRPTCETWYMEGKLKPGVHYIEVKEDFSDLGEKLEYYSGHTDEANEIISNAHKFVAQFFDDERELLIQLLVVAKYLKALGLR